jgi:hypothetical protein
LTVGCQIVRIPWDQIQIALAMLCNHWVVRLASFSNDFVTMRSGLGTQFGDHGTRLTEVENSTKQIVIGPGKCIGKMERQLGDIAQIMSGLR